LNSEHLVHVDSQSKSQIWRILYSGTRIVRCGTKPARRARSPPEAAGSSVLPFSSLHSSRGMDTQASSRWRFPLSGMTSPPEVEGSSMVAGWRLGLPSVLASSTTSSRLAASFTAAVAGQDAAASPAFALFAEPRKQVGVLLRSPSAFSPLLVSARFVAVGRGEGRGLGPSLLGGLWRVANESDSHARVRGGKQAG
jgi:hypothetical protein